MEGGGSLVPGGGGDGGGGGRLVSVNVGVLGHVDSGKTSLCKALSTTASTAAFDSNPQSKERGITLDLGFSAFTLDHRFCVTLVDCPGHASLVRTVLGGTQIMDFMILVIDINKGMQAQTWECLILAGVVGSKVIVVLNKVDLIEAAVREKKVKKFCEKLKEILDKSTGGGDIPIALTSAVDNSIGVEGLINILREKLKVYSFERDVKSPLVLAVDHCFTIRGAGAVCTGTILQGAVKQGDMVEFPELQMSKKVKTMQIFKEPVTEAFAGDRVALGMPGLDSKLVERGIICAPGLITSTSKAAVVQVFRIEYFKEPIQSNKRYHITMGYSTVTAMLTLFSSSKSNDSFDKEQHFKFETVLNDPSKPSSNNGANETKTYFALLEFDKPVVILPKSLLIASNLQNCEGKVCRLAFHGRIIENIYDKEYKTTYLPTLNIYWFKKKTGTVDRVISGDAIIAKGFCQKQSNIDHLIGLKVTVQGEDFPKADEPQIIGNIQSRFGQTNKIRISLNTDLTDSQINYIKTHPCNVNLLYKEYKFKGKPGALRKLIQ